MKKSNIDGDIEMEMEDKEYKSEPPEDKRDIEKNTMECLIKKVIITPNVYHQKKTIAQGMMDLALFSANVNQLHYVLKNKNILNFHKFLLISIGVSIVLQIAIGVGLLWNVQYKKKKMEEGSKLDSCIVLGLFIVTIINIFICAFGSISACD